MELYIFKTNIENQNMLNALSSFFQKNPAIKRWTVDTEDEDRVLKIETRYPLLESELLSGIRKEGYTCESL